MSNRLITYMSILVIIGMGILFLINFFPGALSFPQLFQSAALEKFIKPNDVEGVEIIHDQKPYVLNFSQQNHLLELLNLATPTNIKPPEVAQDMDIQKIVIHRLHGAPIEITPLAYINNELLFSAPAWRSDGLLKDMSAGEMKTLLSHTYDH